MRRLLSVSLFILVLSSCALRKARVETPYYGDMLYLRSGEEYDGTLQKVTENKVYFLTREGNLLILPLDSVQTIDVQKRREGYWWRSVEDINDELFKEALNEDVSAYSYAGFVDLYLIKKMEIQDGKAVYQERDIRKILNKRGEVGGNITFSYKKGFDLAELNFGRTVSTDGRVYHIKDIAIEDAAFYSGIPFYDRLHERKCALPEAKPGNVLDFKFTVKSKLDSLENPVFRRIYLAGKEPVLDASFILEFPEGEEIKTTEFSLDKPQVERKEDKIIYRWCLKDWKGVVSEPQMPPLSRILPSITVGQEVDPVQYREAILKLSELDRLPEELVSELAQASSFMDTLKRTYYFVTTKVRYVSVPLSHYSPLPHSAKEILEKRVANCFDKAFLLYSLLRKMNIEAHLILVPDKDVIQGEFPGFNPFFYSGAIVQVNTIFMNPEDEFQSFGYVSPRFQGTPGFDVIALEKKEIPVFEPARESVIIKRSVRIDTSGTIYVREEREFDGIYERKMRTLKKLKPEELRKEVESLISEVDPRAILLNFEFDSFEDPDRNLKLKVEYYIPEFAIKAGDYLLFKLPGIKYDVSDVSLRIRQNPVYHDHLYSVKNEIELFFPRGFRVKTGIGNFNERGKTISYSARVMERSNSMSFEDETVLKKEIIEPGEEYQEYRNIKLARANYVSKWIILKR